MAHADALSVHAKMMAAVKNLFIFFLFESFDIVIGQVEEDNLIVRLAFSFFYGSHAFGYILWGWLSYDDAVLWQDG